MTISLSVIDIDKVRAALFSAKTERKRIYPADEAAVRAITEIVGKRLEVGKKHYTVSTVQVMALGFTRKTARNALEKLRAAGILKLWARNRFKPDTKTGAPAIYTLNSEFVSEEVPTTRNGLWLAWYQKGGSFGEYHSILSTLEEEHERVTADMLAARLTQLREKSAARFKKTNPEGVRLKTSQEAV